MGRSGKQEVLAFTWKRLTHPEGVPRLSRGGGGVRGLGKVGTDGKQSLKGRARRVFPS